MATSRQRRDRAVLGAIVVAVTTLTSMTLVGCAPTVDSRADYIMSRPLPSDVTAKGVVLAAILLASGDIDNAVGNGLVTPAEVDTAKTAIAEHLLEYWTQRAEKEAVR